MPADLLLALHATRSFKSVMRFHKALKKMGIERALRKAGVNTGDLVRIGTHELEWFNSDPGPIKTLPRRRKRRI